MASIGDELWVYISTDDTGETGVAYMVTAGSAKIPLIAPDEKSAQLLEPIVRRLASITARDYTLVRFTRRHDVRTIAPGAES